MHALLQKLVQAAKPHLSYWILIALILLFFRCWLTEHDARLLVVEQLKVSQQKIDSMAVERQARDEQSKQQQKVIVQEVQAAKTPQQETDLIHKLTPVPLNPVLLPKSPDLPNAPSAVKVDLDPLVQQLSACKQDSIELGTCQADLRTADATAIEKDKQVQILQKRPGVWHRFGSALKVIGCAAGGGAIGSQVKGNTGANAGIGAAGGAALCSLF